MVESWKNRGKVLTILSSEAFFFFFLHTFYVLGTCLRLSYPENFVLLFPYLILYHKHFPVLCCLKNHFFYGFRVLNQI